MLDLPKRLEDWRTNSLLFGDTARIDINFPWVKVDDLTLKKLRFYGSNENGFTFAQRYRKFHYKLLSFLLKSLVRTRVNFSFYDFPIDYHLYKAVTGYAWNRKIKNMEKDVNIEGLNQDTAVDVLLGVHRNFKNS